MPLEQFARELLSMGFSEETIYNVVNALADLYIVMRVPLGTKYWTYNEGDCFINKFNINTHG